MNAICRPTTSDDRPSFLLSACALVMLVGAATPGTAIAGGAHAPPPAGYPRYRLIELGTLGGANGMPVFPGVTLNDRGEVIAQASTNTLDPDPGLQDDFIWHGILSGASGAVHDLGALPGINQSFPSGISANGLIAGFSTNGQIDALTGFPELRAVSWDAKQSIIDLGTLGGNTSIASQVNSRGVVVGFATNATAENADIAQFFFGTPAAQQVRGFVWKDGSMRDLGTLGGNDAGAILVNESGEVCGISATGTQNNETTGLPTIHPFLWKDGKMQDLGSRGGTIAITGSFANGPFGRVMNERGDVVGTSTLTNDEDDAHAFYWSHGRMTDLGTLGGLASEAYAINDNGQVVGRAEVSNAPYVRHAFVWEKGTMTDLGTVGACTRGTATSINDKAQIVGGLRFCTDDPADLGFNTAFYVEKGKPMVDLNDLVDPPSDLHMDEAMFINERGEIVAGVVTSDGGTRVVLLVPLPGH